MKQIWRNTDNNNAISSALGSLNVTNAVFDWPGSLQPTPKKGNRNTPRHHHLTMPFNELLTKCYKKIILIREEASVNFITYKNKNLIIFIFFFRLYFYIFSATKRLKSYKPIIDEHSHRPKRVYTEPTNVTEFTLLFNFSLLLFFFLFFSVKTENDKSRLVEKEKEPTNYSFPFFFPGIFLSNQTERQRET